MEDGKRQKGYLDRYHRKKYGIKISNLKYAAKDHYIAYAYGVDGEIVGLWNKEEGIPYGRVEVRLLNEKRK